MKIIKSVEKEMKESYIDYAMSVIIGRALPDVRDGLKPVHRRILYAMHLMGNNHNKPYKKSARVIGETMGKFHPHGDTAIYDSIVRMAQEFSMRYELVDGQGNFGSIDGDRAASMRYTEMRLSRIAEEVLKDIDKETVDWAPNFDGTLQEPMVLPSKVPNLIINGSSGIAVGMATNMLPHNLIETVNALIYMIDNPNADINEIMKLLPAPDFPTGGIIMGTMGVKKVYVHGRGNITVRAKTSIIETKKGHQIRITEFPYQTNKAMIIAKIAGLVKNKNLDGIKDIKDMSDRKGILVIIDIEKGFDPEVVLKNLYKHTDLQKNFGVINLALVNGIPRLLGIKQLLSKFIDFRIEIVTKRTKFDLEKAEQRRHIVKGLLVAVNNINKTVEIIKSAQDVKQALQKLISEFNITEIQGKAILDMKLHKLTGLEIEKLETEIKELNEKIIELNKILENKNVLMNVIKTELEEIRDKYGDKRKTEISTDFIEEVDIDELVNDEPVVIILTNNGYVKRVPVEEYRSQGRGGKGVRSRSIKSEDIVKNMITAKNRDMLLVFTDDGKVYWLKAYKIPEMGRYAKGKHIRNLLQIGQTSVRSIIPVRKWDGYLVTFTKKGIVKRTKLSAYSHPRVNGIIALKLKNDDKVVDVKRTTGEDDIIIITKQGMAIRFSENNVREVGRTAQGVTGIRMKEDNKVVSACIAKDQILTIKENGIGKRTEIKDYRRQYRGGHGVIDIKTKQGKVVSAHNVTDNDDVMLLSSKGMVVRTPVKNIRTVGRNTKGVRIMRLKENDKIVASAVISKKLDNENDTENQKNKN